MIVKIAWEGWEGDDVNDGEGCERRRRFWMLLKVIEQESAAT